MQFELKQKNCQNLKSITLDMHYQEIYLDLSKLCLKISPKLLADISKGTVFH